MIWEQLVIFAAYTGLSLLSLLLWWVVYELVITTGLSVHEAVFGRSPNPAVALDIVAGLLALGILNYAILSEPELQSLAVDLEATALTLLGTIFLLGLLRLGAGGFLRLWFRNTPDLHGQIITINNELFRQRNLATGLFSAALYLILVTGLVQEDLLNLSGYRWEATFNMLGVWLLGAVVMLLHSWVFLGLGKRHHILHECFHDNNPAAALSLLGLVGGMLLLTHSLLESLPPDAHMFNGWDVWVMLAVCLVVLLIARWLLQLLLLAFFGISLRKELVVRDNPAWGVLDAGLILVLSLILLAVLH